ncbi:hypothetical protein [Hyphomicrobium sp.]|uniref:hypothetical protein n=1 Tax=Hyphomicrobium sp. TaxID=82 RepID=UPI001D4E15CE|nr:hypothetical protein [Hyphomicrobium sp.]MBY0560061.1 hypothetical protein [Hyphomicrobium sp.]
MLKYDPEIVALACRMVELRLAYTRVNDRYAKYQSEWLDVTRRHVWAAYTETVETLKATAEAKGLDETKGKPDVDA